MITPQFRIVWRDTGRMSQLAANPAHPKGVDLDFTDHPGPRCKVKLPYPARCIGAWGVRCLMCGVYAACTTAGLADDPRSITMSCKGRVRL